MAAVNSEHGGCEPKPPDRCESSFFEPGIQISGPGRLSKISSHPEAPINQSVDDKLKYMPMEEFQLLLNVLHEAGKDKSKLKSANSEQAEIISELEHHSKGSSHPEEPIQSLNAKFTSSLQSLSHQELSSSPKTSNNYSCNSSSNSNTVSCTSSICSSSSSSTGGVGCGNGNGGGSCYTPRVQISNQNLSNAVVNSNFNTNLLVVHNQPYVSILHNNKINNNNNNSPNYDLSRGKMSDIEPPGEGGVVTNAPNQHSPGHPNHNYSNDIDMEEEEESNTPIQYFFTQKDNAQQMIDAADPISNSYESDGLADFYPSESHSTKHMDGGSLIDPKDGYGSRSIQLHDEFPNTLTGPGGLIKPNLDLPRSNTPTNYSSGMLKNSDLANSERGSRFRHSERSAKNKRKPPKGETTVRQQELPGFVGDQEDIEKLVQFVEGRTVRSKRNQDKKKSQRDVRSKSKEKDSAKTIPGLDLAAKFSSLHIQSPPVQMPLNTSKPEDSVQNVEAAKQEVEKGTTIVVREDRRHSAPRTMEEEKMTGEEGSDYILVKNKRKSKRQTTPTKESFSRGGEQARRDASRRGRSGGSRRKSVGSVPGSENSASDGEDSVKSLPASSSTSEKVPKPCISSGGTPQTSYAEIVRIALDEERKRSSAWMKCGDDRTKFEEFPSMGSENSERDSSPSSGDQSNSVKPDKSDVTRCVSGSGDCNKSRKGTLNDNSETSVSISNSIVSSISSAITDSSVDTNSPETCRVDSSIETLSIAPSVPFNEPLVPSPVPMCKVMNNVVERRNTNNDNFHTLNSAKFRPWPGNTMGCRETRMSKTCDGKVTGNSQFVNSSPALKGSTKNKFDHNSYLAKAAQNVPLLNMNPQNAKTSVLIAGKESVGGDVGFPALVSVESYSHVPVIAQGPWSKRLLKQVVTKDSVIKPSENSITINPKQVNGLSTERQNDFAQKTIPGSQFNITSSGAPKLASPSTCCKSSPKVDPTPCVLADKPPAQENTKVPPNSKGRKEDKSTSVSNNSYSKKTEQTAPNAASTSDTQYRKTSQDSFKGDSPKGFYGNDPSKSQKGRKDNRRRNSFEREREKERAKEKDREREKERERILEREREREMELDRAKEREREQEKEKEKVQETSNSKKVESTQELKVNHPVVNGEATEGERAKIVPEMDIPEDCKSICSEKSYVSLEITQSVPVVFCGENFKETTCCLPSQSFGFEFGFGVNEIMESAYTQGNPNDPITDAAEEVMIEEEAGVKEDVQLDEVGTISPDEVTEGEEEEEEQQALTPGSQPSPKNVSEESRATPSAEQTQPVSVRQSQSHHVVSHSNRHINKYSSSHHRNYQYPQMNHFNPSMPPPQSNQMQRLSLMSPSQYIPQQAIPRGTSPIQTYCPPVYPPPHLAQSIPPMNMPLAYGNPPLMHLGGRGNPQDPNAHPGYPINQQIQPSFVPGFGIGMCKAPSSPVIEPVVAPAPPETTSAAGSKSSESSMSETSIPPITGCMDPTFPSGADIAHLFVPLPATISAVTEREVQQFMEEYVEKLNDLCRKGSIKFHRL